MAVSIPDSIGILFHFLTQAKAALAAGSEARSLRNALVKASDAIRPYLGQPNVPADADALAFFLDSTTDALKAEAVGFDREEGEAAARRVQGILDADLIDDEETLTNVAALMAEWRTVTKSTTGGGRRSGESSVPDLGFTVMVKDDSTGDTVASTTKDNLNSLRDQLRKHHEKVHGSKPGKGDPVWEGITAALSPVFKGEAETTSGGGYTVSKAA